VHIAVLLAVLGLVPLALRDMTSVILVFAAVGFGLLGVWMLVKVDIALSLLAFAAVFQIFLGGEIFRYSLAGILSRGLLFIAILRHITVQKRAGFAPSAMNWAVFIYLVSILLSAAAARDPWHVVMVYWVIDITFVGLYFGLCSLVDSERRLAMVLRVLVWSTCLMGLVGVYQIYAGGSWALRFLSSPIGQIINGPLDVVQEQAVRQAVQAPPETFRISALLYNAGYYAAFLGFPYCVAVAGALVIERIWLRRAMAVASVLLAVNILYSLTRGALLALIVSTTWIILHRRRPWLRGVIPTVLVLLVIGTSLWVIAVPRVYTDLARRLSSEELQAGAHVRFETWETGLLEAAKRRFLGGGITREYPQWGHPHNIYLQASYQYGALGVLALVTAISLAFLCCRQAALAGVSSTLRWAALSCSAGAVYSAISSFFLTDIWRPHNGTMFWMMLGLAAATRHVLTERYGIRSVDHRLGISPVSKGNLLVRWGLTALALAASVAGILTLPPFAFIAVFQAGAVILMHIWGVLSSAAAAPGKRASARDVAQHSEKDEDRIQSRRIPS